MSELTVLTRITCNHCDTFIDVNTPFGDSVSWSGNCLNCGEGFVDDHPKKIVIVPDVVSIADEEKGSSWSGSLSL